MATEHKSTPSGFFFTALALGILGLALAFTERAPEAVSPDECARLCAPAPLWVWTPTRCECDTGREPKS